GTRPAFDYELLRQFAQNRLSASLAIVLLVGTIGFLSSLWAGAITASIWTAAVLIIHAITIAKCRRFLNETQGSVAIARWRLRFVILDLCFGISWMLNVVHIIKYDSGSGTFMLFVMLLIVAVASMLASSLPTAMLAATLPVTFSVAIAFILRGDM